MTKQDYQLIAAEIKRARTDGVVDADTMALRFAETLALHNSRFDRWRFLNACGVKTGG